MPNKALALVAAAVLEARDKLVYLDAADLSERFRPDREEPPGPQFTDDESQLFARLSSSCGALLWTSRARGSGLQRRSV
jgi:hypothetical protein